MKNLFVLLIASLFALPTFAQAGKEKPKKSKSTEETAPAPASATPEFALKNAQDSLGYAIGMSIATDLKRQGFEVNYEAIAKAMADVNAGKPTLMPMDQIQGYIVSGQQAARKKKFAVSLEKANKFLAENKTKPGVITTASGLQYVVLREGTGAQPTAQSNVTTHYHGTLLDGTVFDSSVERGQPASFQVGGVIKAWQEMLVLMREGGKVRVFCPPHLAYGEQGAGAKIGPNECLIFEIELIKVN